ncbi:MAG TPA: M28 family metallopeptidase [Micromonospora sp.]|nr:M28 family metallopeptidase [Micromonospora sp.]
MVSRTTWYRGVLATATAVLLGVTAAASPALAEPNNNNSRKLRQAVTAEGVFTHLKALQKIAEENGGTRVSGSPGYDKSIDYAESVFQAAGFRVTQQSFDFQTFRSLSPSVLQQVSPEPAGDVTHSLASYSGSGDVTEPASLPTGRPTGCTTEDFGAANVGTVVIIIRGDCTFGEKASAAADAGAAAVIIYNNVEGVLNATLGGDFTKDISAVTVTLEVGQELVAQVPAGLTLRMKTETFRGIATTSNIFAESTWGDPNNVVMAGAHLDSVAEGPGINDNGSGSATLLEIAKQMQKVKPKNKVRFALWGAEESGLLGAHHYIDNLPEAEREKISLYLNFDMIGSPNYVRFVYDGDNSAFPVGPGAAPGPEGSGAIEQLFHDYFASQGLASAETPFSGRSDYGPFIEVGIPAGGLFTGAEGIKTEAEAAIYGGTAGISYDPCYHQACDDIDNVSVQAIDEMADAVAHAIITYAFDTSSIVKPTKGKGKK